MARSPKSLAQKIRYRLGGVISEQPTYSAFISYAHDDEKAARRLHEALESYHLPDGILVNGRESFSPIFRDITELTASHSLSEKIRQALQDSSFLIVLCSPAAKNSHWVNEEIRLFRSLHGDRAILSAIVEGSPSTSFPPALLENGHEPLAANLKQGRDNFRFGVHQLAASILGVGLDTLVQRGERKRRLRTQLMTGLATGLAIIMGGLWVTAQSAQKQAEQSRDDAERLVEYMVSDLKSELYSLQRLDILDGLGEEIVEYYEGIEPERLPDDRLVKLITALQTLAEVSNAERKWEKSHRILDDASKLIEVLEKRAPKSDNALFYRAQNEFWEGQIYYRQSKFEKTLPYWERYRSLGYQLYGRDPDKKSWIMEAAWGHKNVALIYLDLNQLTEAKDNYMKAIELFEQAYDRDRDNVFVSYEFANALTGLANTERKLGNIAATIKLREKQVKIYDNALKNNQQNYKAFHYRNQNLHRLTRDKGHSPCRSELFIPIYNEGKQLHLYEPKNVRWRREYLYQKLVKAEDCVENYPGSKTDLFVVNFFNELTEVDEQFRKDNLDRIKKLRAK